jgi:adenylate cyclase
MMAEAFERRLVAIAAADISGYGRLVGLDEEGTLTRLRSLRGEVIDPTIAAHRGRIVKTTGDGILVEFQSVVDAVRCAVALRCATAARETGLPPQRHIAFRSASISATCGSGRRHPWRRRQHGSSPRV